VVLLALCAELVSGLVVVQAIMETLPTTTATAIAAERMETVCIQNPFLG
jgi:hypothetical protein